MAQDGTHRNPAGGQGSRGAGGSPPAPQILCSSADVLRALRSFGFALRLRSGHAQGKLCGAFPFLLVFVLSFAVYLRTLCPTVYVVGSGELTTAVRFLGIAHPTGYPLYTLLAHVLSSFLPFQSVAYRLNVISALLASASVALLYYLGRTLFRSELVAFSVGLLFAFSSTFWSQAVIAEVYTFNVLLLVSLLLTLTRWRAGGDRKRFHLFAFLYGLALAHHLTALLWAPGIALFVWGGRRHIGGRRGMLPAVLLFLLGISLYLYLPVRWAAGPRFAWNAIEGPRDLLFHITGREYGDRMFAFPWRLVLNNVVRYGRLLSAQFGPLLWTMIPVGMVVSFVRNRSLSLFLLLSFLVGVLFAVNYDINDIEVFYIPSFLIAAIWMGYGLRWILNGVQRISRQRGKGAGEQGSRGARLRSSAPLLLCGFMVLLPLLPLISHFHRNDRSRNEIARRYGEDILRDLEPNAVLLTKGDDASFILLYLQQVEGMRPDVSVYSRIGRAMKEIYGRDYNRLRPTAQRMRRLEVERRLIEKGKRPVYYQIKTDVPPLSGVIAVPEGLVYRVSKEQTRGQGGKRTGPLSEGARRSFPSRARNADPDSLEKLPFYKDAWVRKLISNYYCAEAERLMVLEERTAALRSVRKMGQIAFDSATVQYNVGIVFLGLDRPEEAVSYFKQATELDSQMGIAWYGLGRAHSALGDVEGAIFYYEQALRKGRAGTLSSDRVYNALGNAYARKGMFPIAVQYWQEALRINPRNQAARANLERLRRGR